MSADEPAAILKNIVITMEPPRIQPRLSAGIAARYHAPRIGIASIGRKNGES